MRTKKDLLISKSGAEQRAQVSNIDAQSNRTVMTLFTTSRLMVPNSLAQGSVARQAETKLPQFVVKSESAWKRWAGNIKTYFSASPRNLRGVLWSSLRYKPVAVYEFHPKAILGSVVLHGLAILLLPYLLILSPFQIVTADDPSAPSEKIYYRVSLPNHPKNFPKLLPMGSGGQPGTGSEPLKAPLLGSDAYHPDLTVASRPKLPDNRKQTILQSLAPPDLRIKMEVQVPNLLLGSPKAIPRPALKFDLSKAKTPNNPKTVANAPAPDLVTARSQDSLLPLNSIVTANSHLPVAPAVGQMQNSDDSVKMTPVPIESGLPIEGSGKGLLAIGTEPAEKLGDIALPPGNRMGEFSISPAGGRSGSPGGAANGTPNGGTSGSGSGGDGSFGVGPGKSGGGGGAIGEKGSLSVVGSASSPAGETFPDPGPISKMVYPLPAALLPRKNALVIYTGPTGGGGLNVYRALSCGKIFSIFLRMPGKPWSLQYCPVSSKVPEPDNKPSQTMVVTMPQSVVPPEAIKQFDFRRLPLPPEKLHKLIVLKGVIHQDGSVDRVTIYQGLLPAMDEAAKLAVSQWKFRPALRNGKPIELEVLVGIPSDQPLGRVNGKPF